MHVAAQVRKNVLAKGNTEKGNKTLRDTLEGNQTPSIFSMVGNKTLRERNKPQRGGNKTLRTSNGQ